MEKLFKLDLQTEQATTLAAKFLLMFNRSQIHVKQMKLNELPEKIYGMSFWLLGTSEKVEKTCRLISKQVGILSTSFSQVEVDNSNKSIQPEPQKILV